MLSGSLLRVLNNLLWLRRAWLRPQRPRQDNAVSVQIIAVYPMHPVQRWIRVHLHYTPKRQHNEPKSLGSGQKQSLRR
jgi:hypothetical protein